jgi:putative ABC transport system ATP-binding protein
MPGIVGEPGPAAGGTGSAQATAVELLRVSKHYGRRSRGVHALREVTVAFPHASVTAVMGLTGSGKSTLLQCAAGLDKPSSGTVRLGGTDLGRLSRRKLSVLRRREVGFVFQALNLVPTLTVAENIALPLRLDRRAPGRASVRHVADRVGIGDLLRRLPHTLSGGQQQRVAIARALVTDPKVIFADEPTAALDPCTSGVILDLLRGASDDLGQTVVVVTHQPEVAARADRTLILDRGTVAGVLDRLAPSELTRILHGLGGAPRPGGPSRDERERRAQGGGWR